MPTVTSPLHANSLPESDRSNPAGLSMTAFLARSCATCKRPRPSAYWTDFLLTSFVGWSAFALAVYLSFLFTNDAISGGYFHLCALPRPSLRSRNQPFHARWNARLRNRLEFPVRRSRLLPSFVYSGMHQDHHRISFYGTERDPEYLPFASSRGMTTCFAIESFLIPVLLVIRFLVVAPLGLLCPPLHRWLAVHASSLVMNFKYRRDITVKLEQKMKRWEFATLLVWGSAAYLAWRGVLPWRIFAVWFLVVSVASFVNTLRTLGAHDYESAGQPTDRLGQLIDSIDHPGAWWTELWAPVGLRYHALHHYFPGIPYHNLSEAYRRLIFQLPAASDFHQSTNPSLPYSLRELYRKAGQTRSRG